MDPVWFCVGLVTGMVIFSGATGSGDRKKLQRQLTAAIKAGEVSVVDKDGKSVTAESLLNLLQEQFKKA